MKLYYLQTGIDDFSGSMSLFVQLFVRASEMIGSKVEMRAKSNMFAVVVFLLIRM